MSEPFKPGWYIKILDIGGEDYIRLPEWISRLLDWWKGDGG